MNAQSNRTLRRLASGEALHLGRLGGELAVIEGRVWLTRDGDLGDHVVEPGQRVRLGVDENAVIESARTGDAVAVRWYPRRQSFVGALAEEPLRGLAFLTGLAVLLGAVGVTGDTSDNDEACAVAGIQAAGLKANAG